MYIIPIPFDGPKLKPSKSYMILNFLYEKKRCIYERESLKSCFFMWGQNINYKAKHVPIKLHSHTIHDKNPKVLKKKDNLFTKTILCSSCIYEELHFCTILCERCNLSFLPSETLWVICTCFTLLNIHFFYIVNENTYFVLCCLLILCI